MKLTPYGLVARTLRLELGLTLKAMADAIGVTSAYLSSIELGERDITAKIKQDALDFFRTRVDAEKLQKIGEAIDQTAKVVQIEELASDEKVLVAAFARRLTEGAGVPDEVLKWLQKGERYGRS
ncbi:hypothetical protein C0J09_06735 [Bordetella avium]|uniref:helix-turn-helix domain-containing protein n=1 Tax=Bordetella avium TaxID=521 RepID=UPI000FDA0A67|nr:helix-turn-helix transcriptional regulator [Bordetella avium]AZY48866.1 hypothetical protein C0J09_06735 [Bordetella avium]